MHDGRWPHLYCVNLEYSKANPEGCIVRGSFTVTGVCVAEAARKEGKRGRATFEGDDGEAAEKVRTIPTAGPNLYKSKNGYFYRLERAFKLIGGPTGLRKSIKR